MRQLSVIWTGNPFFQAGLADLGWRVHWRNPPDGAVLTWTEIIEEAGFVPDVFVAADKSTPPFVVGMESFPCLTVFYAVDTHIHSWFPHYAQGFDIALVSLRDHIPLFLNGRLSKDMVWRSPPFAAPDDVPREPDPLKAMWDVLFVGKVDPAVNPERHTFFSKLAPLISGLHVTSGAYRELFPQAKIVLNHSISNDLNFRVFEALGCGACLVTPFVGHGLEEMFARDRDLFIYDQNDLTALSALLKTLLASPERRRTVAAQGHAKIAAGHYMHHRAKAFADKIESLVLSGKAKEIVAGRRKSAKIIHNSLLRLLYLLHAETAESETAKAAYLHAAQESPLAARAAAP